MLRRVHPRGGAPRTGGALVLVLLLVLLVSALAASFLRLNAGFTRRQAGSSDRKEAFYVAEAGLTEAFAGLTIGKTGSIGSEEQPARFGEGAFWVEAEDLGGDLVRLDATALAGSGRAQLSSVVHRGSVSVASLGVFAAQGLDVLPGTLIDGYNAAEGAYAAQDPADLAAFSGGRLGSNGDVVLHGTAEQPTVVHGDVAAGPGHALSAGQHVTITGTTAGPQVARELPPVQAPGVPLGGAVVHDGPLPLVLPSGSAGLASLRVGAGSEVRLLGPLELRVGSLRVDADGRLVLDNADGAIRVFADELAFDAGSSVEVQRADPTSVSLLVTGSSETPVELSAASAFHGVVYAPGAEVRLGSPFELFGALVADRLTMLGPVRLHFDQSLLGAASEDALPRLVSWRIVELGQIPGVPPGGSPFELLGLDPELLPPPAGAHADQYLEISYLDAGDQLASFQGMESAFDWGNVKEPLAVVRSGNLVPAFEPPGSVVPPEPPDPALQVLLDAVADTGLGSIALRDLLVAAAPVPEAVLDAALAREPAMGSPDLRDVLQANLPLPTAVLLSALAPSPLSSGDLGDVLQSASPLPSAVLQAAVSATGLASQDLRDVMVQNSPLAANVLTLITSRIPALPLSDLLAILGAQ